MTRAGGGSISGKAVEVVLSDEEILASVWWSCFKANTLGESEEV